MPTTLIGGGGTDTVGLGEEDMNVIGLSEIVLNFNDDLRAESFVTALLTGAKPRACLLPQRGAQVAPVATYLSNDTSEMQSAAGPDEENRLQDFAINPAVRFPADSTASPESGSRSPKSGVRGQESGVRGQKSEIRSQVSPEVPARQSFMPTSFIPALAAAAMVLCDLRERKNTKQKSSVNGEKQDRYQS